MAKKAPLLAIGGAAIAALVGILVASTHHTSVESERVGTEWVASKEKVTPVAVKDEPAPSANAPAAAVGVTVEDVVKAASSLEPGSNDILIEGLSSQDGVIVAEAANGLVGRGALSALPALQEIDVATRPWAAPSVIYAMGALAAKADPDARSEAVDRLLSLLASEKKRPAADALANLLQIYEALGQTGDARAIAPLEAELADASVATAPKVVIVQALVALGAKDSRPALERLRAELTPTATGPDFESELRRDLIAAIGDALERLT